MTLREKIDGLMISWIEKDGHYALNPDSLDALESLIISEKKAAVEEAFSRCLTKQDKAQVTQWSEVLSEMFPS